MLLTSLVFAAACSVAARTPGTPRETEIRDLEQSIEAAVVAGDTAYLRGVYADDLTFTHSTGRINSKEELLKMVAFRPFIARVVQTKTIQIRKDTAETSGWITVTRKPRPTEKGNQQYTIWYVRIYHAQLGRWRLSSHTTTKETPPKPMR